MIKAGFLLVAMVASLVLGQGIDRQVLFRAGEGAYNNYRIPALLVTGKGTVLAFCEGRQTPAGPGNDTGEINIIVRRSTDGGNTFSAPAVVWADGKNTCGNPCVVYDAETSKIVMLMTRNRGADHERDITAGKSAESRTAWVTNSSDDGVTWEKPTEITKDVKKPEWAWYATGPGIGIQIQRGPHRGRLVIPCDYVEVGGGIGHGNSHVIYSDDHGATWRLGGEPPEKRFNEAQVVELSDGAVMLNMRPYSPGKRAEVMKERGVAVSKDGGETFEMDRDAQRRVDPVCQASIFRYGFDGRGKGRILFSNPPTKDGRLGMWVRESIDDGKTWPTGWPIFEGRSGYSCLCKLGNGEVGILYEAGDSKNYERIEFVRFGLDSLEPLQ